MPPQVLILLEMTETQSLLLSGGYQKAFCETTTAEKHQL